MVLDTSGLESVYDWNLTLRDLTFTDWIRILWDLTSWKLTIGDNWLSHIGRYKELGRLVNMMINSEVILAAFKGTWLIRL